MNDRVGPGTRALVGDGGRAMPVPTETAFPHADIDTEESMFNGLAMLRDPFPLERIEKLPKPTFKGAWDGKRGAKCTECHGYHVLENCIHLDYVGHANVTDRLLEVDPLWEWEPMAYTEQGTPLFSDGGLWIRLTVCGVTRIGYGDGKSVKEVIGDAIRNAAMRFGVGLDLWAKIDLHTERNPGDGEAPRRQDQSQGGRNGGRRDAQGAAQDRNPRSDAPVHPPRAANQDALDQLAEVCNQHGYSQRYALDRYTSDYDADLRTASVDDILNFAAILIDEATADPRPEVDGAVGSADAGQAGGAAGGEPDSVGEAVPTDAGATDERGGVSADREFRPGDPTDDSDVQPGPNDLF